MRVVYKNGREYGISARCVSKEARKVIKVLQKAGYRSYIVGGGVRDLLLKKKPEDFDIATAARPDTVRSLFKRCRLIGKRFRLAHVFYGDRPLEVATFRKNCHSSERRNHTGRKWQVIENNQYGTLEEDMPRRDFTVNAMYYDPFSDELICHPSALSDLSARRLRLIGDPQQRYREDPVRILRGLRLATKLNLNLERKTAAQIVPTRSLLLNVPHARLYEECKKLFYCGASLKAFQKIKQFRLFELLFPKTASSIKNHPQAKKYEQFLKLLFTDTDTRIALSEQVMPAFTFAGLWLPQVHDSLRGGPRTQSNSVTSWKKTVTQIAMQQRKSIAIPVYVLNAVCNIYGLQAYFASRDKKDINHLSKSRCFRTAYDFFYLLAKAKLSDMNDFLWWEKFQQANQAQKHSMMASRVKDYPRCRVSK